MSKRTRTSRSLAVKQKSQTNEHKKRCVAKASNIQQLDIVCIDTTSRLLAAHMGSELLLQVVQHHSKNYEKYKMNPNDLDKLCECVLQSIESTSRESRFIIVDSKKQRYIAMTRPQQIDTIMNAFMSNGVGVTFTTDQHGAFPSGLAPDCIKTSFANKSDEDSEKKPPAAIVSQPSSPAIPRVSPEDLAVISLEQAEPAAVEDSKLAATTRDIFDSNNEFSKMNTPTHNRTVLAEKTALDAPATVDPTPWCEPVLDKCYLDELNLDDFYMDELHFLDQIIAEQRVDKTHIPLHNKTTLLSAKQALVATAAVEPTSWAEFLDDDLEAEFSFLDYSSRPLPNCASTSFSKISMGG